MVGVDNTYLGGQDLSALRCDYAFDRRYKIRRCVYFGEWIRRSTKLDFAALSVLHVLIGKWLAFGLWPFRSRLAEFTTSDHSEIGNYNSEQCSNNNSADPFVSFQFTREESEEQYACALLFYISSCLLTVPLIKVCSFMCFKGGSTNLFEVFGSNSILLSWTWWQVFEGLQLRNNGLKLLMVKQGCWLFFCCAMLLFLLRSKGGLCYLRQSHTFYLEPCWL